MNFKSRIYRSSFRAFLIMALLVPCKITFPQILVQKDTIVPSPSVNTPPNNDLLNLSSDTRHRRRMAAISPASDSTGIDQVLLDSLKSKAEKSRLMKKLFSFVIVPNHTINEKGFTGKSEEGFVNFSGIKIRNIEVRQLNVFGTNINNPVDEKENGIDNLLNKSHFNTNEKIIRKNLLFSEGDTISPLNLSENERILRQLPFIDDARIIVIPVSENEADITVLTKDVYSLGASVNYRGLKKGAVSVFEKNIFGTGHEFGIDIPYDSSLPGSPGFGVHYKVNNIGKSFINLNGYYLNGLGKETYGASLSRKLVSAETKYAGGITLLQMSTTEDLDTLDIPAPLKYNIQDYWLQRSFLINRDNVSRVIVGIRYTNNNVFDRPYILPDSYRNLQNYRLYLASATFSIQKFYKTKLIYSYGRTEDVPYGGLIRFTAGKEYNEFNELKNRTYLGTEAALGKSIKKLGYFYAYTGTAAFINGTQARQGLLTIGLDYFSNLIAAGNSMIRNFLYFEYTRGIDRNLDEHLLYNTENGFSGFRNDSICGTQRISVSVESVLFLPSSFYGIKFAIFGFADFAFLSGTNTPAGLTNTLTGLGLGIRLRNDNLVFNTLQVRIGFFPNPPEYSRINHVLISGEQLLKPPGFDTPPPEIIPYR
jgi:hypothetical protein